MKRKTLFIIGMILIPGAVVALSTPPKTLDNELKSDHCDDMDVIIEDREINPKTRSF